NGPGRAAAPGQRARVPCRRSSGCRSDGGPAAGGSTLTPQSWQIWWSGPSRSHAVWSKQLTLLRQPVSQSVLRSLHQVEQRACSDEPRKAPARPGHAGAKTHRTPHILEVACSKLSKRIGAWRVEHDTGFPIIPGVVLIQAGNTHKPGIGTLQVPQEPDGLRIGQIAGVVAGVPDLDRIDACGHLRGHPVAG